MYLSLKRVAEVLKRIGGVEFEGEGANLKKKPSGGLPSTQRVKHGLPKSLIATKPKIQHYHVRVQSKAGVGTCLYA